MQDADPIAAPPLAPEELATPTVAPPVEELLYVSSSTPVFVGQTSDESAVRDPVGAQPPPIAGLLGKQMQRDTQQDHDMTARSNFETTARSTITSMAEQVPELFSTVRSRVEEMGDQVPQLMTSVKERVVTTAIEVRLPELVETARTGLMTARDALVETAVELKVPELISESAAKVVQAAVAIDTQILAGTHDEANERRAVHTWVSLLSAVDAATGDPDLVSQADAAAELARVAGRSELHRTMMLEQTYENEGAIARLVALLDGTVHAHDALIRHHAATALGLLCRGGRPGRGMDPPDVCAAILAAGGVRALCRGLTLYKAAHQATPEEQVVCAAYAAALAELAADGQRMQDAIARAGALPPLIRMLSGGSARMQANAAAAISMLAAHGDLRGCIASAGGFTPLRDLLSLGAPEVREHCALALWRLVSHHTANKRAFVRAGGIDPLVGVLLDGTTQAACFYAGRALVHLATDNPEGAALVRSRLLSVLLPPYTIELTVRHALVRHRMGQGHLFSVLGTLVSMALEPARLCLAYELTPLDGDPPGNLDDRLLLRRSQRATGSPTSGQLALGSRTWRGTAGLKVFEGRVGERPGSPELTA